MSELYFSFDDGVIELHPTAKSAEAAAQFAIDGWTRFAQEDGEWPDEAQAVCWGKVIEHAKLIDGEDGSRCELQRVDAIATAGDHGPKFGEVWCDRWYPQMLVDVVDVTPGYVVYINRTLGQLCASTLEGFSERYRLAS